MLMSQFVRFVGVGGINTLVTYILYVMLLQIFSYQVSYTITYVFGIFLSYWLNLKFVFKETGSKKKMLLFPLVYLLQYLLGIIIMYLVIEKLNIPKELAPIVVVIVTIPLTFLLSKIILTKRSQHE